MTASPREEHIPHLQVQHSSCAPGDIRRALTCGTLRNAVSGSTRSTGALSEYLGPHDPGFTLRVYRHLMPGNAGRARQAVEAAPRGEAQQGRNIRDRGIAL